MSGLHAGTHLEKLKIIPGKEIGKGSYGRVLEIWLEGTLCAAKEIHWILVENVTPKELEYRKHSFLKECELASTMRHPNLVQVLGTCYPTPHAKLPWLVMELMDTSLSSFLKEYGASDRIPMHFKFSILVDIAQGLEYLHAHDVVHRDLSSNNILLTKHLVAKISDLGVAKVIEVVGQHTQMPGTLHFMPPEAQSVKPQYDKSVDVFSFACITLHVMSNKWPTPEYPITENEVVLTEVERRKEYLEFCTLSSLSLDSESVTIDFDGLRRLVESCLQKIPEKRPDISKVRAELGIFFTFFESFCSLGKASRIDIYEIAYLSARRINELCLELKNMDQKLNSAIAKMKEDLAKKDEEIQKKTINMEGLIDKIHSMKSGSCSSDVAADLTQSDSLAGDHRKFADLPRSSHDLPNDGKNVEFTTSDTAIPNEKFTRSGSLSNFIIISKPRSGSVSSQHVGSNSLRKQVRIKKPKKSDIFAPHLSSKSDVDNMGKQGTACSSEFEY